MNKLYCLIRATFMTKFAYMKAFWFNIFGTTISIIIYYFLWKYVFQEKNTLNGFTMDEITAYVVLSRVLSSQFAGGINRELSEWIYKGNIVVELMRPVNMVFTLWGKRIGEFAFFCIFKGFPITILGIILLHGALPFGPIQLLFFFISVLISICLIFWIEIMVGMVAFYTLNSFGVASTKSALLSILSGGIVPIFLFPPKIASLLNYLPFASMVTVPVNIYLGKYSIMQSYRYMGLQIIWVFLLGMLAMLFCHFALKKVVVQGG